MTSEEVNELLNHGNIIDARNEGIELGKIEDVKSMLESGMTKDYVARIIKFDINKVEKYLKK